MKLKNQFAVQLGRLGGLAKSSAKAIASRHNGRKGGRPKNDARGKTIVESCPAVTG